MLFEMLEALLGGNKRPTVHHRRSKIDKVNGWKERKKARGEWLPHDEWLKRKRRR